jgi:pimeloyl-ACP methyl ester carboxylesterase
LQPAHAAVLSPDITKIVPDHFYPAHTAQRRGTLLIAYGSSSKPNYRNKVRPLAEKLNLIGLRVITFDYRSNLDGADFSTFGIHDRIEDAKQAIEQMKRFGEPPFSILGLGMGGHIVVRAAAETDDGNCFKNVILISPKAYPEAATRPGVLFGTGEGKFFHIISKPDALMTADACKAAAKINARLLLIRYRGDAKLPQAVTDAYRSSFGKSCHGKDRKLDHRLVEFSDIPHGTLTDPRKVSRIVEEIDSFTATQAAITP